MTTPDGACLHRINRGGWRESQILRRCSVPMEPRNTFSNLAYLAGAAFLLTTQPASVFNFVLAGSLTLLGVGSGLYHALKFVWTQKLDNAGMYAVFVSLLIGGIIPENATLAGVIAAPAAGFLAWRYAYKVKMPLDDMMGLMLAISLLRPLFQGDTLMALGSLAVFGGSYYAWQLDKKSDTLGLWGHALWHVGTAIAIVMARVSQG